MLVKPLLLQLVLQILAPVLQILAPVLQISAPVLQILGPVLPISALVLQILVLGLVQLLQVPVESQPAGAESDEVALVWVREVVAAFLSAGTHEGAGHNKTCNSHSNRSIDNTCSITSNTNNLKKHNNEYH